MCYNAHLQVHISFVCLYCDVLTCFNVQKALYFSHTACAAAPLFTLCLKPEPSLLWLVSWPALLWLVNRLEMSCSLAYHVQWVGALANRGTNVIPSGENWDFSLCRPFTCTTPINKVKTLKSIKGNTVTFLLYQICNQIQCIVLLPKPAYSYRIQLLAYEWFNSLSF